MFLVSAMGVVAGTGVVETYEESGIVVIQRWWRRVRHTIPELLAMIRKDTEVEKVVAVEKLDGLARDSADNRVAINQTTRAIAALLMQVGDGTRAQMWAVAYTLQSLALSVLNRVPIPEALVAVNSNGTDSQRGKAGDAPAEVDWRPGEVDVWRCTWRP